MRKPIPQVVKRNTSDSPMFYFATTVVLAVATFVLVKFF